ncbi:oxidoreductase, partial [Streptomyces beijiangensis]|nr:oxidoreductase [Streptomyces beijiangensis]
VRTLLGAGVEIAAMITGLPRHKAAVTDAADTRLRRRVPLLTDATVAELLGRERLSGIVVRHADGRRAVIACDTVVFTGDFVPDHELARRGSPVIIAAISTPAPSS